MVIPWQCKKMSGKRQVWHSCGHLSLDIGRDLSATGSRQCYCPSVWTQACCDNGAVERTVPVRQSKAWEIEIKELGVLQQRQLVAEGPERRLPWLFWKTKTRDHGPTGDIGTVGPCCNAGNGPHGLGELANSADLGPAAEAGSAKRLTAKTGARPPGNHDAGPVQTQPPTALSKRPT